MEQTQSMGRGGKYGKGRVARGGKWQGVGYGKEWEMWQGVGYGKEWEMWQGVGNGKECEMWEGVGYVARGWKCGKGRGQLADVIAT